MVIRAQEATVWNNSSTFAVYDAILAFIVHTKSKVSNVLRFVTINNIIFHLNLLFHSQIRKAGQQAVCAILKGSNFCKDKDVLHPAAGHTGRYCVKILENSIAVGGMTTVLHVLGLLKEIIVIFPKPHLKVSYLTILV